jgi:hypothetical protein
MQSPYHKNRANEMPLIDFKSNATDAFYSAYKYGIKDCAPSSVKDAWACTGVQVIRDYDPFTHTSRVIREEYNKLTVSLLNGQTIHNSCCELPPTDGSMSVEAHASTRNLSGRTRFCL